MPQRLKETPATSEIPVVVFSGQKSDTLAAEALRLAREGRMDGPVVALLPDSWDRYLSRDWARVEPG